MAYRSAITGRYISKAANARWKNSSVKESSGKSKGNRTVHRSAKTGQFVTAATAKRCPKTTLKETV